MTENQKRLGELAERSYMQGRTVCSDFLGLSELSELLNMHIREEYTLWGGYENAERVIAVFGKCDDKSSLPVKCVKIAPVNPKFAENLTHRDFLGALISLGIRREKLGDIIVENNEGYLFCLDTVADFIVSELKKIRHTSVSCSVSAEIPKITQSVRDMEIIVSSLRADVLICSVFSLSRNEAMPYFERERVFINGKTAKSPSQIIQEGDKITVRGKGRFEFSAPLRKTKKDRIVALIKLYQ